MRWCFLSLVTLVCSPGLLACTSPPLVAILRYSTNSIDGRFLSLTLQENLAVVSARVISMGNVCARDAEAVCNGTEEAAERVAGLSLNAEEESAGKAREMEKKVWWFLT